MIYLIAGARPNFMKIAPLIHQIQKESLNYKLIHTGQHYDQNMSKVFFEELDIPEPDIHLNVGSGSHAIQTAKIMIEFEKVIVDEKPKIVVVVGDVNSTIACALVAKKLNIDVVHVEAGLRSFDRKMPEEINRILTDQLSDILFTTEKSGKSNLEKEGIDPEKILFVGNIMIDTLVKNIEKAKRIDFKKFNLKKNSFALMTFHRPSNVDSQDSLSKIIEIVNYIRKKLTVFIPIHPRTRKKLIEFNLYDEIAKDNVIISDPIGYLEFLNLMMNSRIILTDSGGIQEEASFLKIPILTLRENTERPITIELGTNELIGTDFNKLKIFLKKVLSNSYKIGHDIEKWDGNTAERIITVIKRRYFK